MWSDMLESFYTEATCKTDVAVTCSLKSIWLSRTTPRFLAEREAVTLVPSIFTECWHIPTGEGYLFYLVFLGFTRAVCLARDFSDYLPFGDSVQTFSVSGWFYLPGLPRLRIECQTRSTYQFISGLLKPFKNNNNNKLYLYSTIHTKCVLH